MLLDGVPLDEPVARQVALDRVDRAGHPRVGRRQEPDERDQERRRVELVGAVRLHERVALRVERLAADLVVDRLPDLAPLVDRPREVEALDRVDGAVERDPGEHLRVREVAARAAHFPDPFVGPIPGALEEVHQVSLQRPRVVVGGQPVRARLVQGVHHLAVDVELELLVSRVADAHRL